MIIIMAFVLSPLTHSYQPLFHTINMKLTMLSILAIHDEHKYHTVCHCAIVCMCVVMLD
jgi:hypothetical protein